MPSPSSAFSYLQEALPPDENKCQIQFVHVGGQTTANPASCTANARSHVMKRFHRRKQLDLTQRLENFRCVTGEEVEKKHKKPTAPQRKAVLVSPRTTVIAPAKFDPFNCLAVDASSLPALMSNRKFTSSHSKVKNAP